MNFRTLSRKKTKSHLLKRPHKEQNEKTKEVRMREKEDEKEDKKQAFSDERCYRCGDLIRTTELDRHAITKLCSGCENRFNS